MGSLLKDEANTSQNNTGLKMDSIKVKGLLIYKIGIILAYGIYVFSTFPKTFIYNIITWMLCLCKNKMLKI